MKHAYFFMPLLAVLACQPNTKPPMPTPKEASELELIDESIARVFDAICFDAATGPTMYQLKEVFVDEGLLINYNEEEPVILPVDDFIKSFEEVVASGAIPSLEDKEVRHETRVFDKIAHRYSFYEARFTASEAPFARGVNSIQLIKTQEGWKVTSMAWNDDNRGDGFFERMVPSH